LIKLGFTHEYSKLEHHLFSTIRRYDHYPVGVIHRVTSPKRKFNAILLLKVKMMLKDIPTPFLCYDTDTKTRNEALLLLNSFYNLCIAPNETLTILFFEKTEKVI